MSFHGVVALFCCIGISSLAFFWLEGYSVVASYTFLSLSRLEKHVDRDAFPPSLAEYPT